MLKWAVAAGAEAVKAAGTGPRISEAAASQASKPKAGCLIAQCEPARDVASDSSLVTLVGRFYVTRGRPTFHDPRYPLLFHKV